MSGVQPCFRAGTVTRAAYARTMTAPTTLTDTDRELLRIFGTSWSASGRMETAIRERTGLSRFQAAQRVSHLIDTEAALAAEPVVTNRLRRLRALRKR